MRILVTGGAGFIGSHYVRTLLGGGYAGYEDASVTVLDALTYAGNLANLAPVEDSPRLRFVAGDIADADLVRKLVPGHDAVINFAAQTHVDRSIEGATPFMVTNATGVQVLAQACLEAGAGPLVQVSTDEVYGSIASGSWTEQSPIQPNSPYAAAKAGGDLIALAYARTHGLDVRVTRGCNTYGPYQYPEKIVPLFVTNLLDGQPVPLYGDGGNVRGWVHVDDHCRGVQLVLTAGQGGQVYHQRQRRADQPGADPGAPAGLRGRAATHPARAGPQGPRPALCAQRRPAAGPGLPAADPVRRRAGRDRGLVPGPPGLVGAAAAQVTGGPARGRTSPPTATAARPGRRGCR